MSANEIAALLGFLSVMSFTPGPNTMLSSALAANYGLKRALPFICAVPLGWLSLLWACAFGLGLVLQSQPLLAAAVKYTGIAYMLYLAWRLWQSQIISDPNAIYVGFAGGVALQWVNIKAWMGAITIFSTWIAAAPSVMERTLVLSPVFMAFAFTSNLSYAFLGAKLRGYLLADASLRRVRMFNRVLAVALALTCVWMMTL
jgi:threonine/homoserine/homoserine lactone efflux protein